MTTYLSDTDLRALAFFLADHGVVENGKAYINGGFWNQLGFPSFPVIHSFAIVAVLEVPWCAYHQKHTFGVWFQDADNKKMPGRFEGEFQVRAAPDMRVGDPTVMPIAAVVNNFVFQRPGDYTCVLEVDGTEINRWRFRAVQAMSPLLPAPEKLSPAPLEPPSE